VTILAGESRVDSNDCFVPDLAVVIEKVCELTPSGIGNRLGEAMVFNQVGNS
jgi:hypothetical protein